MEYSPKEEKADHNDPGQRSSQRHAFEHGDTLMQMQLDCHVVPVDVVLVELLIDFQISSQTDAVKNALVTASYRRLCTNTDCHEDDVVGLLALDT